MKVITKLTRAVGAAVRVLPGTVKYLVYVGGIDREIYGTTNLNNYLEGLRDGRLTCPCLACRDHFHWVDIRERNKK